MAGDADPLEGGRILGVGLRAELVDPLHARKMAARMQAAAANGSDRPILLRIEPKAGHGQGKPVSKQIEEGTDTWSFLFWQLGVKQ